MATQVFGYIQALGYAWVASRGYTRVLEDAQGFGSPIGATHRCLDPQQGLHTGVWIPNRGYIQLFEYAQVFGSPARATM